MEVAHSGKEVTIGPSQEGEQLPCSIHIIKNKQP
jgi:hypothetical protein